MGRTLWILMLLSCCATPLQSEKPLSAEETYQKIREVFLLTPAVAFEFRSPRYETPMNAVIANSNRVRIARDLISSDGAFICNGDLSARIGRPGDQPSVGKAPPDYAETMRKDLLRGLSWEMVDSFPAARRMVGTKPHYILLSNFTGTSQYVLGRDETGSPSLSFIVYEPGWEREDGYPVSFRYDPKTYALLHVESRLPASYGSGSGLIADFRADPPVLDGLFGIPEDPKIRVERTKADLALIREALDRYLIDNHAYPTTVQSMDALVREPQNPRPLNWKGPYLKREAPVVDAWGRPYSYRSPRQQINPEGYDLWSWGWDGKSGTGDDLKR